MTTTFFPSFDPIFAHPSSLFKYRNVASIALPQLPPPFSSVSARQLLASFEYGIAHKVTPRNGSGDESWRKLRDRPSSSTNQLHHAAARGESIVIMNESQTTVKFNDSSVNVMRGNSRNHIRCLQLDTNQFHLLSKLSKNTTGSADSPVIIETWRIKTNRSTNAVARSNFQLDRLQ